MNSILHQVILTLVFSGIGLALFGLVYFILVKTLPFSLQKEIEDDQNVALGIVLGSVFIGIALIVSAAIHG